MVRKSFGLNGGNDFTAKAVIARQVKREENVRSIRPAWTSGNSSGGAYLHQQECHAMATSLLIPLAMQEIL